MGMRKVIGIVKKSLAGSALILILQNLKTFLVVHFLFQTFHLAKINLPTNEKVKFARKLKSMNLPQTQLIKSTKDTLLMKQNNLHATFPTNVSDSVMILKSLRSLKKLLKNCKMQE